MTDPAFRSPAAPPAGGRHGRGLLHTAVVWMAVAVLAVMAFGSVLWAVGLLFHLVGFLLRVAVITAVVAFVWNALRRRHRWDY
jgi:hypothetical protein